MAPKYVLIEKVTSENVEEHFVIQQYVFAHKKSNNEFSKNLILMIRSHDVSRWEDRRWF